MPMNDWQFWIVTAFAAIGLWFLARPFLASRKSRAEDASCPHCTSSAPSGKSKRRRVLLTIERKKL
jgi:hypothetical protein